MKFQADLNRMTLDDMILMEEDKTYAGILGFLSKFLLNGDGEYVARRKEDDEDDWDDESLDEARRRIGRMSIQRLMEIQDEVDKQIKALTEEVTGGPKASKKSTKR